MEKPIEYRRKAIRVESDYPVLSQWMQDNRISQDQLARMLFMAPNTLRIRMRGYKSWHLEEAQRLEQLTGIPINMLFRRSTK